MLSHPTLIPIGIGACKVVSFDFVHTLNAQVGAQTTIYNTGRGMPALRPPICIELQLPSSTMAGPNPGVPWAD